MTKHGWFSDADLGEVGALVTRDTDGNRVIQFPEHYDGGYSPRYRPIPEHKLEEGR